MIPRFVSTIGHNERGDIRAPRDELKRLWQNQSRTRNLFIQRHLERNEETISSEFNLLHTMVIERTKRP